MKIKSVLVLLCLALGASFTGCKKEDKTPQTTPTPAPPPSPLPTVSTAIVSSVSSTMAISGGTVSSEGTSAITAVGVCWDINPSPTTLKPHTDDGAGIGTYSSVISGLSPNTTYYVRSYATNASGTAYGNEFTFTTSGIWSIITPSSNGFYSSRLHSKGGKLFAITAGSVISSSDNGITWSASNTGIVNSAGCLADDGTSLFAGGYGNFYISTNDGASWTAKNNGLNASNVTSIKAGAMGIVAATDNGIFITTNAGNNWMPAGLTNTIISELAVVGSTIFAGTGTNGLYVSVNNGANWTPVGSGLSGNYISNITVSGNNIIVSTDMGNYISVNNNGTWNLIGGGLPTASYSDFSASGNKVLANLGILGIYYSSNNGQNWINFGEGIPTNASIGLVYVNSTYAFAGSNNYSKLFRRTF